MIKYLIILIIILVLLGAYFMIFHNPTSQKAEPSSECPASFVLYPYGQFVSNAIAINYSIDGNKYFSQASGGYGGYQGQLAKREISKEEFLTACAQYKSK